MDCEWFIVSLDYVGLMEVYFIYNYDMEMIIYYKVFFY